MQDKNEQPSVYLRAYKSETETLLDVLSAYSFISLNNQNLTPVITLFFIDFLR
jgi:hypothetical protein